MSKEQTLNDYTPNDKPFMSIGIAKYLSNFREIPYDAVIPAY